MFMNAYTCMFVNARVCMFMGICYRSSLILNVKLEYGAADTIAILSKKEYN
jgi:hypothetical protein